jgi:hypothetical protein
VNTKYLAIAVAVIVVIGGLFLLGGANLGQNTTDQESTSAPSPENGSSESVVLSEQNSSGENGIATLREVDGKVVVDVQMTGGPQDTPQPAHIHLGECPTPGEVLHPLTNVVSGESETSLDVSIEDLKGRLPLAINIHKSESEPQIYTACGNLSLE